MSGRVFGLLAVVLIASMAGGCSRADRDPAETERSVTPMIRLAVLGDSDSHSYGDRIWFPADSGLRGDRFRQETLQWTEVIEALRADEIDQGPWGTWGTYPRVARVANFFGARWRAPRKEDYRYNFAITGNTCRHMVRGTTAQAAQLLNLMRERPSLWQDAVVQVRIGINSLGTREFLDRSAAMGLSREIAAEVEDCANDVVAAAEEIRAAFPSVRIVLVGVLNNSDWPPYFGHWQSATEQRNIEAVLDAFDARLSAASAADANMAFFDDRAWFSGHWGARDADGKPAYKSLLLGGRIEVTNTQGNEYPHAILTDGHGGTLQNAVWSRDFIDFLNERFDTGLSPVQDSEIVALAESLYGIQAD